VRNTGILLVGLSLLTLAIIIVLSRVAEAIFLMSNYAGYVTPYFVYILIGIVFLLGLILIFFNKLK
jgi:hypothetical protein